MKGTKFDSEKIDHTLIPVAALDAIAKVMMYGQKKYARNNYRLVDDAYHRYVAAAMRHLLAFIDGEDIDAESGLPHLHMALTNLAFLAWFESNGTEIGGWR